MMFEFYEDYIIVIIAIGTSRYYRSIHKSYEHHTLLLLGTEVWIEILKYFDEKHFN